MKKYRIYLVITGIVTVTIIAVWLVRHYGGFTVKSDFFAINDIQKITSVTLESDGEKVALTKENTTWKVNGHNDIREDALNRLLDALSRLTIKSTVTDSEFQKDWKNSSASVIRLEIRGVPMGLKSYLVYPVNTNPYGNYFKKREGGTAYMVNIPGYRGNVGSLFVTNEKHWLPNLVYTYNPSEIREIIMMIPGEDSLSYRILQDDDNSVRLFSHPENLQVARVDTVKILRYLSYFSSLRFEHYVFDLDSAESKRIISSQPLHELTIRDFSGNMKKLRTWPIINITNDIEEIDLNRIYGRIDDEQDLIKIRYVDIDPILKIKSYFLKTTGDE